MAKEKHQFKGGIHLGGRDENNETRKISLNGKLTKTLEDATKKHFIGRFMYSPKVMALLLVQHVLPLRRP